MLTLALQAPMTLTVLLHHEGQERAKDLQQAKGMDKLEHQ